MNNPSTYMSSDYAGLTAKNASFYYGYEETYCKTCDKFMVHPEDCEEHDTECCFVASFNGKEIKIPFSKLGGKYEWNCRENLLLGIGWIFAKYHFELDT